MSRLPGARGPLGDLLSDLYYESVPLVTFNILWLLLTLPVVTAFPAVGGLVYATNQMAHDKHVTWRTFMAGFRAYFWTSWRWGLMNLLVVGMLVANVAFYRQIDAAWAQVAQLFFTAGIVVWLLVQLYTLPLLIEQAERNLREALRNSLVVWLRRPVKASPWPGRPPRCSSSRRR